MSLLMQGYTHVPNPMLQTSETPSGVGLANCRMHPFPVPSHTTLEGPFGMVEYILGIQKSLIQCQNLQKGPLGRNSYKITTCENVLIRSLKVILGRLRMGDCNCIQRHCIVYQYFTSTMRSISQLVIPMKHRDEMLKNAHDYFCWAPGHGMNTGMNPGKFLLVRIIR